MPELPEVETIVRSLARCLVGRRLASCRLLRSHVLQDCRPRALQEIVGRRLRAIARRGKYLVMSWEGGVYLVFHLKMTGQFLLSAASRPRDRHTHLIMTFKGRDDELRFRDVRKFGRLSIAYDKAGGTSGLFRDLGPEPLAIGLSDFEQRLRQRRGRLKSLLLNQSFLAGIGNIYADEILFEAGLHPLRPADRLAPEERERLWLALRRVLRRAISRGGSSIRNYTDTKGRLGFFQLEHKVYGREAEPCPCCSRPVRRLLIGGRSSHFCPRCQPS